MKLHRDGDEFRTLTTENTPENLWKNYSDELKVVYENGFLTNFQSFEEIQARANEFFEKELSNIN